MKEHWKKIVLSVLLIICVSIINCSNIYAANGITRGEWIHDLVNTFDMKIEDGLLPDDYYGDISDSQYYNDIMVATNFGVIDLEAGNNFKPDEMVTREFAAHTLNYCLGYELSDEEYTMNDKDDLVYAADDQIAINFGWLSLKNGDFLPNDTITTSESTKLLDYAVKVLDSSKFEENHNNSYVFTNKVKEIPETTSFDWNDDGQVVIHDTDLSIKEGDWFAVYEYGIAYTYEALDVTSDDSDTTISVKEVSYDDSVKSVDAQGEVDVNLGDFIPASDDIVVNTEYEDNTTTDENAPISKATKKEKKITLTKNVGAGKVTCNITGITINCKFKGGKYLFSIDGKANLSYTISSKSSKTIPLGSIPVDGFGNVNVTLNLSANGSATVAFSSNFQCGVEYSKQSGVRKIMNFTTPTWNFSAKAELKAACNVTYEINVPSVANGKVFAELGIKSTPDAEVFGDGKKPTCCIDLPAWLYANVGYSVKILGTDIINETIPIYNESNSPLYVCYHLEDGMRVAACTRGADATRVGHRGYYTLTDATGSYSGNAFVAPWANADKPTFEYSLNDDGQATIKKYSGSVAYLTIPDELDGHTVIAIGNDVFKGNTALQSVVIPDTITTIGEGAFNGCTNITEIELPEHLKLLGKGAFGDCKRLNSISIPDTITEISNDTFYKCISLKEINFSNKLVKIGNNAFAFDKSIENIKIPNSVISIKGGAFLGCSSLSDVQLSKNLTELGGYSFGDCDSLESIEIPKSIEKTTSEYYYDYIYNYQWGVFIASDNLKNISFEEGTTKIVGGMFANNDSIESITIPNTVTEIQDDAFYKCKMLKEIIIPDTVSSMGTYVFSGCKNLEKVHLPNIRINVTEGTFENCSALTEVNLPATLEAVRAKAFLNCSSLTEIDLPNNVNIIENEAFSGCTALTRVTIPESMRTIGNNSFYGCEALTDLNIKEGTTSIGEKAFYQCIALEKVKLPNTLQALGNSAFYGCEKISDLNLGAGIQVIPEYCFYQIPALEKVILPQQITTINAFAFANCTGLKDITINRNVKDIKTSAFSYSDTMVIHGVSGSYAETFAKENDYTFVPLDNPATEIQLSNAECSIARGKTKQLSATVTPLDSSDQLTWTSSDEDILTVTDTGLIKGIKVGEASVIVMAGDVVESCNVTVYEGVTGVRISKTSAELTIGDTLQLTTTVYPDDATNKKVKWSSSNEEVATVTEDGLVTAKAYGKADITVTTEDGGYTNTCNITVSPVAVTGISLNKKSETIDPGKTVTLIPTITPDNATDKTVTWTSSKPSVATVKDGVVTGISGGTAIIIAKTVDGAKTASCTITVTNATPVVPVTGVTLNQSEITLHQDETATLTAQILPEDATNKKLVWSTDNEEVVSVINGVITAHTIGTATITATTDDGKFTASCVIHVKDLTLEGITLNPTEVSVEAGNCIAVTPAFTPDSIKSANLIWTSDSEDVATVNEYGIITAVSEGTAIITASTEDGLSAVCTVTVTSSTRGEEYVPVEGIEITGASGTEIELGNTLTLSAIVTPETATNPNVIWVSSDCNIASIDSSGNVTLNNPGQVTLIATSESSGVHAELTLTVLPAPIKSYTITYNLDGGTNSATNPSTYEEGSTVIFAQPEKEGYIFEGWFTDTEFTSPIEGITATTTGDITLYAKWSKAPVKIMYSVEFDGNGATTGTMPTLIECETDEVFYLPICNYTRKGFTFNGWNTAKDGSGYSYENKERVTNLTDKNNDVVILYAQWKPISYTIHFDKNTAKTGSMKRVYPKYGRNYRLPACGFKKPGYTFAGWNTRKDGKGTTYKNQSNVKNLTTTNGKVVFLYAQWKKVSLSTAGKPTLGNYAAGRLTVTCKAVKGADGYLIQYSTNKNMKNAKTVSSKTLKKNIYKLKKGTTYYVRVRAYKVDSAGKKICGKYSGVQAKKLTK